MSLKKRQFAWGHSSQLDAWRLERRQVELIQWRIELPLDGEQTEGQIMKFQLKNVLCTLVVAAISLAAAGQAQAANLIAAGYSWTDRGQERRTVTFICVRHRDQSIRGWAEFDYTDQPNHAMLITSEVALQDGTVCMAGPIIEHGDPSKIGWTGFFGVRDLGGRGEDLDKVSVLLVAPPEFPDVEAILKAIGGFIPEEQFLLTDGGDVRVW